ncbi:MAG: T9SS type A sorting domain-containing protein [Ignavibacteria bacterium]|nr:T9SS type A sorting domain-containing protein [Ignavibacteria bacterium]
MKNKIYVYPNPASNILYLKINANTSHENISITIYDLKGVVVKRFQNIIEQNDFSVSVNDLLPGIYFYKIVGENIFDQGAISIMR